MKAKYYFRAIVMFILVIASLTLLSGCGEDTTIPSNGTLTFQPSDSKFSFSSPAPNCFEATVVALFNDGTPMQSAEIVFTGSWVCPKPFCVYEFHEGGCATLSAANYRDDGFTGVTDIHGTYRFSYLVSGGTYTFKDSIHAQSGAVSGKMDIEKN